VIAKIARFFRFASHAERLLLGYMAQGLTEKQVLERWRNDLRDFTLHGATHRTWPFKGEPIRATVNQERLDAADIHASPAIGNQRQS
jgi:hypothetical protein